MPERRRRVEDRCDYGCEAVISEILPQVGRKRQSAIYSIWALYGGVSRVRRLYNWETDVGLIAALDAAASADWSMLPCVCMYQTVHGNSVLLIAPPVCLVRVVFGPV
jgi:hypothetical protein